MCVPAHNGLLFPLLCYGIGEFQYFPLPEAECSDVQASVFLAFSSLTGRALLCGEKQVCSYIIFGLGHLTQACGAISASAYL
jgi:hypothetical protein